MEVRKLNWFLPVFLAAYVILNIAAGIFIGIAPELGIALYLYYHTYLQHQLRRMMLKMK